MAGHLQFLLQPLVNQVSPPPFFSFVRLWFGSSLPRLRPIPVLALDDRAREQSQEFLRMNSRGTTNSTRRGTNERRTTLVDMPLYADNSDGSRPPLNSLQPRSVFLESEIPITRKLVAVSSDCGANRKTLHIGS